MEELRKELNAEKTNLGIFEQYAEEIEEGCFYCSYPNFEKAITEILGREKRKGQIKEEPITEDKFKAWYHDWGFAIICYDPKLLADKIFSTFELRRKK